MDFPLACGFFTASHGVFGDTVLVASPSRRLISHVPFCAQLKSATGDLERIRRIVRLEGYVHCALGFRDHPKILDGASDLLLEIFEERGKHVRIALRIPDMPLNACVQLGVWAEVSD